LYVTPLVELAVHVNTTECLPVPVKPMVRGEFVALLAILTLAPLTAPPEVGANVTVSVADCPGVRTVPLGMPLELNPAPLVVTVEIVTFEFPLFVTEVVRDVLLASNTLPKGRLVGLAPSSMVAV
jgi:hypothetical protein